MNWESFDLQPLTAQLRQACPAPEAERMVFAFERAVALARIDPELLSHLFAATACLLARTDGVSPRTVFETYFRRSVSDEQWEEIYLGLFQ